MRFAEGSDSSDSGRRGSGNVIPSLQVLTGMITQIQQNLQVQREGERERGRERGREGGREGGTSV